jgi:A118 family predicted phage portal protein
MQDFFYPISYDSGRLTEAAFSSSKHIDGEEYVYLETHLLNEAGEYVVDNALLKSGKGKAKGPLVEVGADFYEKHNIIPKWETKSRTPLFQMVRPNVANRDSFNSPYGQSVYSGAIDILKVIDTIYDSYYKEFLLGKKRLFVKDGVTNINFDKNTGETIEVFDPTDEVFYRLPGDENDPPLTESNPALRTADHNLALQTQLDCFSQAIGFGSNGFKWDAGAVSTATQIISENSEMFRTLKKHEALIRDAIINMAKGLLYVEATCKNDTRIMLDADITVNFDDSIIEDTAEQKRQAMLEYNAGLIDAIEYYMTVYKLTEDQALEWRERMMGRALPVEEEPEMEEAEAE